MTKPIKMLYHANRPIRDSLISMAEQARREENACRADLVRKYEINVDAFYLGQGVEELLEALYHLHFVTEAMAATGDDREADLLSDHREYLLSVIERNYGISPDCFELREEAWDAIEEFEHWLRLHRIRWGVYEASDVVYDM